MEREVWLWDFGVQTEQRLIHQLHMDQTQVAALVLYPQRQELLDTLGTWVVTRWRARPPVFGSRAKSKVVTAGSRTSEFS